ncbi:hypothetical protein SUGI_0122500 [Cryptomeria japonica]|nr:hypothetical protein SUGI_0122500 [Cryptomeria japonica]
MEGNGAMTGEGSSVAATILWGACDYDLYAARFALRSKAHKNGPPLRNLIKIDNIVGKESPTVQQIISNKRIIQKMGREM